MSSNSRASSMVIVAIPDENDRIWKISSEKVPHLTLLFLGDADQVDNPESIVQFVEHAADRSLNRFYLPVDRRDELGADQADVLFFKKSRYDFKAVRDFRALLLKDDNIKTAYDSTSQHEFPDHVGAAGQPWIPHLTLGYPDTPANEIPDDQMSALYSVEFNKVAVWMGNYEGPEFMLKDYWDEMDDIDMQDSPALAMASANETRKAMGLDSVLEHFGTKGMRWGVRNEKIDRKDVLGEGKQATPKKIVKLDKKWETRQASADTWVGLHNHAALLHNQDIPKLNAKFDLKYGEEKMNSGILWDNNHPITKEYHAEYNKGFTQRLNEAAAVQGTNASGTKKVKIITANNDSFDEFSWHQEVVKIKHAAKSDEPDTLVFVATLDDHGRIISVRPQEDNMEMKQTEDLGIEFLEHHGVKGMRWGVRNDTASSAAKSVGSGVKKAAKGVSKGVKGAVNLAGDISFENQALDGRAREAIANHAGKEFRKTDLPAIKAKPEHQAAAKLKNRLLHPLDPGTKAYRKEVRETYIKRLETSANSMTNFSGDRQFTIRERGIELPSQGGNLPSSKYFWDVSTRPIEHSEMAHAKIEHFISLEVSLDEDGWVTDVKPAKVEDSSLAQTIDRGAEFLEHFGVKGMRWGVRNPGAVTTQTHIDQGVIRRRTKVEAKGGEAHDAHPDAVKAAVQKRVLKKSGTAALSNQDLRELTTRLQLEAQVSQLTTKKGQRAVQKQLEEEGKQQFSKGLRKGAPVVVKQAKKGAATAAVAALI
jgi:2'-5' RNA ligase